MLLQSWKSDNYKEKKRKKSNIAIEILGKLYNVIKIFIFHFGHTNIILFSYYFINVLLSKMFRRLPAWQMSLWSFCYRRIVT